MGIPRARRLAGDDGVQLNRAAALVLEHLGTPAAVSALAEVGLPEDEDVVVLGLLELADAGLVELLDPVPALTRRQLVRRLGLTPEQVVALPAVASAADSGSALRFAVTGLAETLLDVEPDTAPPRRTPFVRVTDLLRGEDEGQDALERAAADVVARCRHLLGPGDVRCFSSAGHPPTSGEDGGEHEGEHEGALVVDGIVVPPTPGSLVCVRPGIPVDLPAAASTAWVELQVRSAAVQNPGSGPAPGPRSA